MIITTKNVDPRIKRTRKLLQQAFMELLQEEGFAALNIQDITDRATVNRATFYAHFPDKYALMDSIVREQFQQVMMGQLPSGPVWGIASLRVLIQTSFNFLSEFHRHCKPTETQYDPMIERAIQQELTELLINWLKQAPASNVKQRVPVKTLASTMSWAIFGIAAEWSHSGQTPSAEEMTNQILVALTEGVAHLTPNLVLS